MSACLSPGARLAAALAFIGGPRHADIGSDHARLPLALVERGRVERCIIVEKTAGPASVARTRVERSGLSRRIEVRLGNGFAPLLPGEVDSASLTGMGARTIVGILERAGEKLPSQLVLQPNDGTQLPRAWARQRGYHLVDETLVEGFWTYGVLHLVRRRGEDPAYSGLPCELALRWGPWLLRRGDPLLRGQLAFHAARLGEVAHFGSPRVRRELALVQEAAHALKRARLQEG